MDRPLPRLPMHISQGAHTTCAQPESLTRVAADIGDADELLVDGLTQATLLYLPPLGHT